MDKYQKGAFIGVGIGVLWGIIYWKMKAPYTAELTKQMDIWSMALIGGKLSKMGVEGVWYFVTMGAVGGWLFAYLYTGLTKTR